MKLSFEAVKRIKEEIEPLLITDENVVSIGTVVEKNSLGESTGGYAIQVGLISKYDDFAVKKIREKINSFLMEKDEVAAQAINSDDVKITFLEEGEIYALTSDFPVTTGDSLLPDSGAHRERTRPVIAGISISDHGSGGAGTLGGIVSFDNHEDELYILSNNHVMANVNTRKIGSPVLQPGEHDGGNVDSDKIAELTYFHQVHLGASSGVPNQVDLAIAKLDNPDDLDCVVKSIGRPKNHSDATVGMDVEKSGRTTGHTYGQIISVDETTKVGMGLGKGVAVFKDQIATTAMSKPGDSGSFLFEKGTKNVVGLVFAGSNSRSYANHFPVVKSVLSRAGFFGMNFPKEPKKFSTYAAEIIPRLVRLIPK